MWVRGYPAAQVRSELTCACSSTTRVFLRDAVVDRVAVAPDRGIDAGSVATVTLPGVVGSSTSERDWRGAGPPVDRLAVCFVLGMFTSSPRSSFKLENEQCQCGTSTPPQHHM
jgi:hypothetical protein